MRRVISCTLVVALVMAVSGCAQKIVMKPKSAKIGSAYDARTGELKDKRSSFRVTDRQVVAWIEFENAHGDHTARFKWYNPDGIVVLDSGPIPVTPDEQWYKVRRVWSVLPVKGASASMMPGKWKVETYFGQDRIDTLKFKLKG